MLKNKIVGKKRILNLKNNKKNLLDQLTCNLS